MYDGRTKCVTSSTGRTFNVTYAMGDISGLSNFEEGTLLEIWLESNTNLVLKITLLNFTEFLSLSKLLESVNKLTFSSQP